MHNAVILMAFDLGGERVGVLEHVAKIATDSRRKGHTQRRLPQDFRKILTFDVLHFDEEETLVIAVVNDPDDALIHSTQAGLQDSASTFGFDYFLAVRIGT